MTAAAVESAVGELGAESLVAVVESVVAARFARPHVGVLVCLASNCWPARVCVFCLTAL